VNFQRKMLMKPPKSMALKDQISEIKEVSPLLPKGFVNDYKVIQLTKEEIEALK